MIFISYRRFDNPDLINLLEHGLVHEFGANAVFRDKSRLYGGQIWSQALEDNARTCPVMLAVIGPTWESATHETEDSWTGMPRLMNPDDWVRKEITLALDAGNVVIPMLLNDAKIPANKRLAEFRLERLFERQHVILRTSDYDTDLYRLFRALRKQCPALPGKPADPASSAVPRLPRPPELYAVPDYILTNGFIGRTTELDELDAWAQSSDSIMVVEGIGGLGKSALTWEWLQRRVARAIPDLAGCVWYGFYTPEASVTQFVRHTLAYVTGRDLTGLDNVSHYELSLELLTELKRRPFAIVLDGFERILMGHRGGEWDRPIGAPTKADLRECVEPRDAELLQQLLHAGPSKVIISSRVFPTILEDRSCGLPIPGVTFRRLDGLSPTDTLDFFRQAKIRGDESRMLEFVDEFRRHSLVLKVVCGQIAKYPRQPFDFDAWRADPAYGGTLQLTELDLKQRNNHILRFALEGLDESKRRLLGRVAHAPESATYDLLKILNPNLPPQPKEIVEADYPAQAPDWCAADDDEKNRRLAAYRASMRPYWESPDRRAIHAFDEALEELQDRGLLQWDRDNGSYQMHPLVRDLAETLLDDADRKRTYLTILGYLEGLPPDDLLRATELSHVTRSLAKYRCKVGAGRLDEAASFIRGPLSEKLLPGFGAHAVVIRLLAPLFDGGRDGLPALKSPADRTYTINSMAYAMFWLGRWEDAEAYFAKALAIDLEHRDWPEAMTHLRNISVVMRYRYRRAEATVARDFALDLAQVCRNSAGLGTAALLRAYDAIDQGRLAEGMRWLDDFHSRPTPPYDVYRPGEAEYVHCLSRFYEGKLTDDDWRNSYELTARDGSFTLQPWLFALRSEWLLTQNQVESALDAVDEALKIGSSHGTPHPDYHDLRAWALARLGRAADARAELDCGEKHRFAAEAWRVLGDREQFRTCALNAHRRAWGEGPPYIQSYELERSREMLRELGEPEPLLPSFDPRMRKPVPFEAEIRTAIARLRADTETRP
jgi:tetratricopeptide (TPR) repeat protein